MIVIDDLIQHLFEIQSDIETAESRQRLIESSDPWSCVGEEGGASMTSSYILELKRRRDAQSKHLNR